MSQFGLKAKYYQQFDADYNLDVPAEGYGGWQEAEIPLDKALWRVALEFGFVLDVEDFISACLRLRKASS